MLANKLQRVFSVMMINIIFNKKTNTLLKPIDEYEKSMFILIDSITKVKNIKYIQFDTSKVIGWLKYDF